jgi:Zn-dependent membrane protease YugP
VRNLIVDVATPRYLWILLIVGVVRIMLSIMAFGVLFLAAAVNQAIITLFGPRHPHKYCVANRRDTGVAGVVDEDNPD